MKRCSDRPEKARLRPEDRPDSADPAETLTRRRVLGLGKKAAFVVPVVWTLTAQRAMAAGSGPSGPVSTAGDGGEGDGDSDYCSGKCVVGTCGP